LHEEIRSKNENTEKHFCLNFSGGGERLDSVIKDKELAGILSFYFQRALRYGLYVPGETDGTNSKKAFLKALEGVTAGSCEITFSHEGFIFNGAAFHDVNVKEVH